MYNSNLQLLAQANSEFCDCLGKDCSCLISEVKRDYSLNEVIKCRICTKQETLSEIFENVFDWCISWESTLSADSPFPYPIFYCEKCANDNFDFMIGHNWD